MIEVISTGFLSKYLRHIDTAVLNWSNGTGVKSGKSRTVPLAGIPDGEKIILVPTHFGQHSYPAWYYNLMANPKALVQQSGYFREYTARTASQDEWAAYWNLAVHYYTGYQSYLERSGDKEIPLFVLEPVN